MCLMYSVCWVSNIFVVQSVNGVVLLLVQMVGAPTTEMCAMQDRDTSGFAGGAHGFSHYDRVCFLMSVFARESKTSSNMMLRWRFVDQIIVTLGGRAYACLCCPSSFGLHNCNFLCVCGSRMSEVSCFVLILIS